MKIANKISLSIIGVGLFTMITVFVVFSIILVDSEEKAMEIYLKDEALAKRGHVETYLDMLAVSVTQFSESIVLKDYLRARNERPQNCREEFDIATERLKSTKAVNPVIFEFLLIDAGGKIAASTDEKAIGADIAGDPLFTDGQKGVYISDAYRTGGSGEGVIAVSSPLKDNGTGKIIGVLAARYKLDGLNAIMTTGSGVSKTRETYIVNKNGYMITPSKFSGNTFLSQRVDTENFRQCLASGKMAGGVDGDAYTAREHIVAGPDYRGVMTVGAHMYLRRMQWCLLVEIDREEVLKTLRNILLVFCGFLFAGTFIALMMGYFIGRSITGPLDRLRAGVEIIGNGELDYKVGTGINDEVGQLSRAFDQMTAQIRMKTASIETLNEEIRIRKVSEEDVKRSAAEWQTTFDSIPEIISIQDLDFRLIRVNKAYAEIFNKKPEELIGKHCYEIVHKSSMPYSACPHARTMKTGMVVSEEIFEPSIKKWLSVVTVPIRGGSGEVIMVVHCARDISAKKETEEILKEKVTQLEKINKFMVDRELVLIELKEKIKTLEKGNGV